MANNGNGTQLARQERGATMPAVRPADQIWSNKLQAHEVRAVQAVAERYQLDPILGHVHVLGGKLYVSLEGWLDIAGRQSQYDGYELRVLPREEKDAMLAGPDDVMFEAKVWRKDRRFPAIAFGRANRNNVAAELRGEKLVIEVAQARAIRKALRNAFRVTELELPEDDDQEDATPRRGAQPERDYQPFWEAIDKLAVSREKVHQILGVESVKDCPDLREAYKRVNAFAQQELLLKRTTPLTKQEFLTQADRLGYGVDQVEAMLGVQSLVQWERQGPWSWTQALQRLHEAILRAPAAAATVLEGEATEIVSEPSREYLEEFEPDRELEPEPTEPQPVQAEPQTEVEPDHARMAEQAVNALQALAKGFEQEEGRARMAPAQLVGDAKKAMRDVLGLTTGDDQALFLQEVFGATLGKLEAAQAKAVQVFSGEKYARGWTQSLIQVRAGKQPLM